MTPYSPDVMPILAHAHFLRDGSRALTFDQFREALGSSLSVHGVSPRGVFARFRDDPAGFLAARSPQSDAEQIIRAMQDALSATSPHKSSQ